MAHERIADLLEFAVEVAESAGSVTLEHFRTELAVESKADASPVTVADRAAERACREMIERRFPDDGILGEEYGETRSDAPRRWVLDPIDGTLSFVRGVPLYGVLVAVEEEGHDLLGVIHMPALAETVAAARGEGCWHDGSRARVSSIDRVEDALLLTTDAESVVAEGLGAAWASLATRSRLTRTWGDCYGHALVATGRAEAMVDPVLAPWDAGPLRTVVEEAGGVFTDLSGTSTHRAASGISTNAALAEAVRTGLAVERPGDD
jgi:histidinol phosphatase-like enzyme (inositol monophosphatase family)